MTAVLWTLGTLFLAAIIHISAVLAIPRMADETAWQKLYAGLPEHTARVLPPLGPGPAPLEQMDPQLIVALCRYDLAEGPLQITVPPVPAYWSLAFVTRGKVTIYSINDRTAGDTAQGIFAVSADEARRFYADLPESDALPLVVEASEDRGVAVLRILADTPSLRTAYRGLASEFGCSPAG